MKMLQKIIELYPNFVVKKEGCPFCANAFEELKRRNIEVKIFDSIQDKELADEIKESTKHTTFPMIYLNRKFVGGFSDLKQIK